MSTNENEKSIFGTYVWLEVEVTASFFFDLVA